MSTLDIVYLHHSGFAVATDHYLLVFDYYQDSAAKMPELLSWGKKVYVFSSHAHGDHFSSAIGSWQSQVAGYILSDDIEQAGGLAVEAKKIHYIAPYQELRLDNLTIVTYGSTDQGVSFAIEADGWQIFHAGDLNWWHWKGDTAENLRQAEELFQDEMNRLVGKSFDVAFFPVDSRLEECRTMGIDEFARTVAVRQIVTMHHCGDVWAAPADFPSNGRKVGVWSPSTDGAMLQIEK